MDVEKVYPIPKPLGRQKTLPFTWPRMLQYTIKGGQKPYFLVKVHYAVLVKMVSLEIWSKINFLQLQSVLVPTAYGVVVAFMDR